MEDRTCYLRGYTEIIKIQPVNEGEILHTFSGREKKSAGGPEANNMSRSREGRKASPRREYRKARKLKLSVLEF